MTEELTFTSRELIDVCRDEPDPSDLADIRDEPPNSDRLGDRKEPSDWGLGDPDGERVDPRDDWELIDIRDEPPDGERVEARDERWQGDDVHEDTADKERVDPWDEPSDIERVDDETSDWEGFNESVERQQLEEEQESFANPSMSMLETWDETNRCALVKWDGELPIDYIKRRTRKY